MSEEWPYTKEELDRYFNDPNSRRGETPPPESNPYAEAETVVRPPIKRRKGLAGFFYNRISNEKLAQATMVLTLLVGLMVLGAGTLLTAVLMMDSGDLPSMQQLENPNLQLATLAYSSDGVELARYALQNRSSVTYDEISPNVINALIATEDHRFHDHWGIDLFRLNISVIKTILGDVQGGSTLTMQLARNMYNKEIGKEQTVSRKVKEMLTAVQLERRYTKREIIEMYLNTVEFGNNAFGIEAAARTFFSKGAIELDTLESATLVGMLKGITIYNPIRNPNSSRVRRNTVLGQMVKHGQLEPAYLEEVRDSVIVTDYSSSEITAGPAPYFSEHVRQWLNDWSEESGHNFYTQGLIVYTTLDSELQEIAEQVVGEQMAGLQTVVNYEWSRDTRSPFEAARTVEEYLKKTEYEDFGQFWSDSTHILQSFVRESAEYRNLKKEMSEEAALDSLFRSVAFMDQLKKDKSRLEAGLVSIDPRTGFVKSWVGGRNLEDDWYDHVSIAIRQPGSTFKPFVYIAAIDQGFSPNDVLMDSTVFWKDELGNEWQPGNSSGEETGRMMTLREGLKRSRNTITARLVLEVQPYNVAFYARQMGIKSRLNAVPSIALGTSNVTLLELTTAYSTLANSGIKHEPTFVTRIEDRLGNVLYEAKPQPVEALGVETALTVIDMMRDVVQTGGTGARIRWQYQLYDYDFAGKTGTTQNSADGWFVLMHPDLVTGAWVGFNDQRMTFRTDFWGQGAHNALFLVGDYTRKTADAERLSKETFPLPEAYAAPLPDLNDPQENRGRVSW